MLLAVVPWANAGGAESADESDTIIAFAHQRQDAGGDISESLQDAGFHPRRLLIRLEPKSTRSDRQAVFTAAGVSNVLKEFRVVDGLFLAEVEPDELTDAISALRLSPSVRYAQPDYVLQTSATPNDPLLEELWGMYNHGQTISSAPPDPGTNGVDIHAINAWDLWTGGPDLRIAVLDTGVDYNHPDLVANIWTNPGEVPNNGLDDDGNGWVDDVHGYDTCNDDSDPMDDNYHGTHVAGTIGAVGDNGLGVAGVNWQCRIVAVKILGPDGNGYVSDAVEGLEYVIDNGIRVSNNSWGTIAPFDQALYDAIAQTQSIGHLFVAAAGNFFGRDIDINPVIPASFDLPNMITVASIDNDGLLSALSVVGTVSVDLAAPGVNILSTIPNGDYGYSTGCSMATPHVTGTVALIMGRRPDLTWLQVRDRILNTTQPLSTLTGRTATGGFLNAAAALGDCNVNGTADEDELLAGTATDCNNNDILDECEPDCNANGVADQCDISSSVSADCNANDIPDECDLRTFASEDCNANDRPDECDLAESVSSDVNNTAVPDECETCVTPDDCADGSECTDETCSDGLCHWLDNTAACDDGNSCTDEDTCTDGECAGLPSTDPSCAPVFSLKASALNSVPIPGGPVDEVTVTPESRVTIEVFLRRWAPRKLSAYNILIDHETYTNELTGALTPVVLPDPSAGAFIMEERPDYLFFDRTNFSIVWNDEIEFYQYGAMVVFMDECAQDEGDTAYLGTLVLDVSDTAAGTFTVCLSEDIVNHSFLLECPDPYQVAPMAFECVTIHVPITDCTGTPDCNGNGLWDVCDIVEGTSADCNRNDRPDECDIADAISLDCNENGVPDECDLATGASADCNDNAIPDECEPDTDCNHNGIQDICDLAGGTSYDCNGNGTLDECDVFFVDAQATGAGTGTGWDDAFVDLQDGLSAADETCGTGAQVWVAGGVYTPAGPGGDRSISFELVRGVSLYGGFAGREEQFDERDPLANPTILSGDLNGDDEWRFCNIDDNSYHVIVGSSARSSTVVDGFVVTAGNADGVGTAAKGGALLNESGSALYNNCRFVGNHAIADGGAVYSPKGNPTFTNCLFSGNFSEGGGGALRHVQGHPWLTNCVVYGNLAGGSAGGVLSGTSVPPGDARTVPPFMGVENSILYGNVAQYGLSTGHNAQLTADFVQLRYSCVEELSRYEIGYGNISHDPLFVDADGADDVIGTADDDVRLAAGSPCIDAGTETAAHLPAYDFTGGDRIRHCRVDLGLEESTQYADCNANGLPDACETGGGLTEDCDENLVPDECDPDCNANGIADACDLAEGTSVDCLRNGIPDECEPDCNYNGIADRCDLAYQTSEDCNGNWVPDECDISSGDCPDCNLNAVPDGCEVTTISYRRPSAFSPLGADNPLSYDMLWMPPATGDVTLLFYAHGDLAGSNQYLSVFINGSEIGRMFEFGARECPFTFDSAELVLPAEQYNALLNDCQATLEIIPSTAVDSAACQFGSQLLVRLGYPAATEQDCNGNVVPDDCETDTDGDGAIDDCDECPRDPDKLVPGQCGCGVPETDSDGDTVPDCIDLCPTMDDTIDADGDGIPDCASLIPATSTWGLLVLALLLAVAGKTAFGRCPSGRRNCDTNTLPWKSPHGPHEPNQSPTRQDHTNHHA